MRPLRAYAACTCIRILFGLPYRQYHIESVLIAFTFTCSLKLKDFHKFDSAATALEQTAALVEGKVTPRLSGLLDSIKDEKKVSLAVADPKLGMMNTSLHYHEL